VFVILAQGAWYAEFVFLYYKIAMASLAVLLGSSVRAPTCLALTALVTAALLVFVLVVKPFDDGSHESPEMLTSADKLQAYALSATLAGMAVGFVCALAAGSLGGGGEVVVSILIAMIAVFPIALALYEEYGPKPADGEEAGDADDDGPEDAVADEEDSQGEPGDAPANGAAVNPLSD
jgi:hypothetical protein